MAAAAQAAAAPQTPFASPLRARMLPPVRSPPQSPSDVGFSFAPSPSMPRSATRQHALVGGGATTHAPSLLAGLIDEPTLHIHIPEATNRLSPGHIIR
jgi:hypothetical protein